MLIQVSDVNDKLIMINPHLVSYVRPAKDKINVMLVDVDDHILELPKSEVYKIVDAVNEPSSDNNSDWNSDWVSRFIALMPLLMNTGCRK